CKHTWVLLTNIAFILYLLLLVLFWDTPWSVVLFLVRQSCGKCKKFSRRAMSSSVLKLLQILMKFILRFQILARSKFSSYFLVHDTCLNQCRLQGRKIVVHVLTCYS
ncbi:hypothetical protein Leryth_000621, partial [Lithospermum erythrorhizon]